MEDKEIIALYFSRNAAAIKYTSDKYANKLKTQAYHILGSIEDAAECVNDTLLNTWNSIPPNEPEYFFGYLSTICRNQALNRMDWNKAKKRNAVVIELTKEMESCIPDRANTAIEEQEAIKELINIFLRRLSKEKRVVFLRRYWYADSYKDIAERMGWSESKVKVTLHRMRNELKKFLEKEGIRI